MAQTVYVVMSNDYTDSVFSKEADADAYALKQNNLDKQRHPHRLIFWRVYALDLDAKAGQ